MYHDIDHIDFHMGVGIGSAHLMRLDESIRGASKEKAEMTDKWRIVVGCDDAACSTRTH